MSRLEAQAPPRRPAGSLRAVLLLVAVASVLGVAISTAVVAAGYGLLQLLELVL